MPDKHDHDCDVLVVTSRRIAEDDHGAGVRTARLVEVLAERYRVVVLEPAPDGAEPAEGVQQRGRYRALEFSRPPLSLRGAFTAPSTEGASIWAGVTAGQRGEVERLRPSVVFWADAIVASAGLGSLVPEARQVVEFANVESRRYLAMTLDGTWKRRAFALLEAVKAVGWQRTVTRRADAVVALALADARALPAGRPKLVVRNGIEVAPASPPSTGSTILAVGSWWYGPNRHGMRRFLRRDWPRIRAARPSARLVIVGRGGDDLLPEPPAGVELAGFVDDLGPLYDDAALVLAPARSGGGSQLKLVGALARGRVIVGPRFLARERVPQMPAGALRAADDVARTVLRLLDDTAERHATEKAILAYCRSSSWTATAEPLTRWLDRLLPGGPPRQDAAR